MLPCFYWQKSETVQPHISKAWNYISSGPSSNLCKHLLSPSASPNTLLNPPFAPEMWQDGLRTKNKQPSRCNRKKNGCGFGREMEGWTGKKGGWQRQDQFAHEGEKERGRKEGGRVEPESESCHKTTIIRSLSATQWPHQGSSNDRLCRTHVRLRKGVCVCVLRVCSTKKKWHS